MIAEELRQRIILKTGLSNITPRDCQYISTSINESLNRHISVTTLKRVFGFTKSSHHPSKYTIATLNDYVNQPGAISASGSSDNEQVYSFILPNNVSLFQLNDEAGLHPQRMVLDALDVLLKNNQENSPLIVAGRCVGIVYVKDLISFLASADKMYGTLYHKFNFSLQSAIDLLQHNK
ncbi:hypothetical protein [Pedobacter nyackensis]|uniref:hypothetical protein n=1 Tax=Pedobacter nyackensis TaxID=475255 RepID=UPI0029306891|nr:hypothetical protein [Pedobacter nyackensis]